MHRRGQGAGFTVAAASRSCNAPVMAFTQPEQVMSETWKLGMAYS